MGNGSLLVMDIRREKTEKNIISDSDFKDDIVDIIDVVPAWKWLLEE